MKKKLLSVLLVAAMTATMLTGCGKTAEAPTADAPAATEEAPAAEAPAAEAVTLRTVSMFGGTDPNAATYQAIIDEYKAANPNVTIEDNSTPSSEEWKQSVAADFASGNEPDVIQFFTDATADQIVASGKLVSIDEIKAEYPDYAADTLPAAMAAVTNTDGVSRAVPTTGYWEGLFCNKDLFDQYELELPTDWNSLAKAIEVFKANGIVPIAVSLNEVPHYWIEFLMLYAAGPEEFVTVPETAPESWVKGLETLKTLRDMGAFPVDTDTIDNALAGQMFNDKQAAMQLDGSWYAGGVADQDNTVVIAFPGIEGQKAEKGAMIGGMSSGFYITKKAWDDPAKRDAAVKFVMAHTNKASVQKYWGGNGSAACAVDPIDGMTALGVSGLDYSSAATSISVPTDARLGGDAYAVLVNGAAKISTGKASAEDVINEALSVYAAAQQ